MEEEENTKTIKNTISYQTAPITEKYIDKVLPYELLVEAITLQNQEIYKLQTEYR